MNKKETIILSAIGVLLIVLSAGITFAVVSFSEDSNTALAPEPTPTPLPVFYTLRDALNTCDEKAKEKFGNKLISTVFDHRRSLLEKMPEDEKEEGFFTVAAQINTKDGDEHVSYSLVCEVIASNNKIRVFKTMNNNKD